MSVRNEASSGRERLDAQRDSVTATYFLTIKGRQEEHEKQRRWGLTSTSFYYRNREEGDRGFNAREILRVSSRNAR